MFKYFVFYLSVLSIACIAPKIIVGAQEPKEEPKLKGVVISESALRKHVVKSVLPTCPKDAVKQSKKSVSISELRYDTQGNVVEVKVVEAPSKRMEELLIEALTKWKFQPIIVAGKSVEVKGRITFYVVTEKGKCKVDSPMIFQSQPLPK
jgi:DNA/RNA endonuclease YhcR with UshA esterase domain